MIVVLTIITFEDLEKLYRDRKIDKSESFDFLSEDTKNFLAEVYEEKNELKMANMIYVHTVEGAPISDVTKDILQDANDSFMAYLPLLDGEPICIVVKESEKVMLFSDVTLDELESASLQDDEEKEFYKEILFEETNKDDACVYAVGASIDFDDIVAILYPEELEEKVNELKEANKEREVLFKTTSLFS